MSNLDKSRLISDEMFQQFISVYISSGNMTETLQELRLTITQVFNKKDSDENLSKLFKETHEQIEESKSFLAKIALRDIMMKNISLGYIPTEIFSKKIFKNPDGEILRVVEERKVSKNPIPATYYSEFMRKSSIVEAASVLAEHGLLPASITKQITQYEEKLSGHIRESFDTDYNDNAINEQELNDILKSAIVD